ncbi:hypothetical protein [Novosphingobium aquimarinum]|uniref:hypothetical protein n=1 Tax=Novosphingobium aquimarinum TaxID=2682494 RepID=UPI0018DC8C62|nr:hypothetical protein [Novosphingobium aquimarinum]
MLDVRRTSQRAQLSLIEARPRQAQNIARLCVATAGGWLLEDQAVEEPSTGPG